MNTWKKVSYDREVFYHETFKGYPYEVFQFANSNTVSIVNK